MKKTTKFLMVMFAVLAICIPSSLTTVNANVQSIFFTGDDSEFKYTDPLYVQENGENRVAYCYNVTKKIPPTIKDGGQPVQIIENATANQFYQMTGEYARTMDSEAFKNAILSVCYQGYPENGTNLMQKYNLSPAVMRGVTQLAVWYYTDSMDISSYYRQYAPFDTNPNAWNAYQELITPMDTLPQGYQLDLYKNSDEKYQNALCTRLSETPQKTSLLLEGKKNLEGRTLQAGEFEFVVTDEKGIVASKGTNRADGSIAFSLIEYTKSDLGTHEYTVSEVKGDLPNLTYDNTTYKITVKVAYEQDQILAAVQGNPQISFSNVYNESQQAGGDQEDNGNTEDGDDGTPISDTDAEEKDSAKSPDTGDDNHLTLWVGLAGAAVVGLITARKRITRPRQS